MGRKGGKGRKGRLGGTGMTRGLVAVLLGMTSAALLTAKGETTSIVMSGGNLATPVQVVDPILVRPFYVWAGAGTFSSFGGGPAVESTEGFIVEWLAGIAFDRPAGLPRYEVAFHIAGAHPLVYTVFYEPDVTAGRAYVYLPGRNDPQFAANARIIRRGHGFEGQWLHATRAWQQAAAVFLDRHNP